MAQTIDVQRVQMSPDTVRHLLFFEGDTNLGRDGGHFVNRLIQLIKAADEENREWIAARFPELVVGVELLMRTSWAFDWLRGLAKKHEADEPLVPEDWMPALTVFQPFPPVSAVGLLPDDEQIVQWGGQGGAAA